MSAFATSAAWPAYDGHSLPSEATPTTPSGSFTILPPGSFNLRGSDYLTEGSANKGAKTPSGACAFTAVSITVIDADRPLFGVCEQLRPLREYLEANKGTEFFVTNRACPVGGGVIRNIITTAKRTLKEGEDPVFDRVWASYKAGDAEYKNQRMKYFPRLTTAPYLLTSAINVLGGQRPVIMGKGYLQQTHGVGSNYTEVSVDISSSSVAKQIAGSIIGYCKSLVIDEGFVVEGKEVGELPERMIYDIQFVNVDTAVAARALKEEDWLQPEELEDNEAGNEDFVDCK